MAAAGRLLAVLAIVLSDFAFKSADSFIPRAQRCVDLNCREAISQGRARKAHRYSADPRLLSFDVHDVITVFSKEAEKDGLWGGVVAGREDKFGYFKKDALIELNIFHTSLPHIVPTKERLQGNVQEKEEETSHNHPPAPQDHLAPESQGENPRTMQGMEDPSVQKSQVPNAEGMVQYMGQEEEDQGAKPIRVQWEHLNYDHPAEQARQNGAPPQEQQHGTPTHEEHPHHEVPYHTEEGQPEQWTGDMQHGSPPDHQQGWPQETPPQAQHGTPHGEDPSPYGTDHQYQQRDDQPPHHVHGESPGSHEEAPHQAATEGHESRIEQPDTHRKKVKVKVVDMGANDEDKDLSNMDVEDLNEYLESLYQDMGEEKIEEQERDVEKVHQKDVEEQQVDTEREQEEDVHKMQHMDREDGQQESTDGELLKDAEWGKQEEQDDIESEQQQDTGEQQEDVEEVQHKGTEDGQEEEIGEGQWEDEERMQQDTGRDALQEDVEEKKWEDSEGADGIKEDRNELVDEEQAGHLEREEIGDDQDKEEEEGNDEEEAEEEEGGDEEEEEDEEGDDEEEWEEEVDGEEEEEGDAVEEEGDWNIDEDRGDLQEFDRGEKEMAKRDFEEDDEHGKEKIEKEEETDLDVQQDEAKEYQERIKETAIPSTDDDDESSKESENEESEDTPKQTTDGSSSDEAVNIELDVEDDMETKGDENSQVEDTEDEEETQEDGKADVTELGLEEDGNDKATDDGTDGLKDGTREESEEELMEDENAVAANQLHKLQEADDSLREENNEVGQKEEIMSQDLTPDEHHIEDEVPENWGSSMGEESAELQKQEVQQEDRSQEEGMDSGTIKEEPSEALLVAEGEDISEGEDIPEEEEQLEDENAAAAASGLEQSDEEKDVESTMLDDSMRQPKGDQMEDENTEETQDSSQLIEQTFEGVIETEEGLPEEKTESLQMEDSDGISEKSDGLMAEDKEELRSDKVEEIELDNEAFDKQHMDNNLKTNDQEATDALFKDLIQKTGDEEVENLDTKMDQASGFDSKASEVNSEVEKLLETPQLKEMQEKIMDLSEAFTAKTRERTERLLSQLESKLPFSSGSSKNVGIQDDTDENLTLKPESEANDAQGEGMQVEEDKEKIESLFPFGSGQDARQQLREQVEKLTKSDYAYQKQQEKMRQEMLEWTAKMKEKREEARKAKGNRGETVIDGTTVNWDEVLEDDVALSTEDLPFDWDEVLDKEAFMSEYSQIMEQPFEEDIMPTSVQSSLDSMMSTPVVDMMTEVLDSGDDITGDIEKDVAKPVMEQTLKGSEVSIDVGETTSLGAVEPTTTQQTEPLQSAHISQTVLPSDQGASQVQEYGQVLPDEPARGYGWDGQSAERTLNLYLEGARREEIIDKVGLGSEELDALRAAEDKEEELAPDHETVMEETVEGMKEDADDDKTVVTDQHTDVDGDMAVVTDQSTDVDDDMAVVTDQSSDVDDDKAVEEEEPTSEPVRTSGLEAAEEEENVPQIDAEDIYIELDFQFIAKLGALVPPEWAEQLRGWGLEYTPSDLIFQGIPVPWLAVITTLLVGIVTFCVFSYKCVTRCVRGKPVDPAVVKRQLEAELEKYAKEKEDLKKGTEAAEDRIRELEETLDVEKFSAQALSKKNSELEAKMSDNDQLELTLRQEIKRLMDQVTDAREQLESATSEYAQQQEIEAEYKKTLKKERKEKEKLQDRLTEFESKSKQLDSEIVSIREHRDLLEESKHQLEEQIQGRQEQFNELKESIEMIKQENEQLKDNVQYKENEIEVLRDCLMQIKALESEDAAAMEEETEDASTAKDEKIQQMLDVARINSTLKLVESERDYLRSRLEEADNSKKEYEEKTNRLTLQVDNLSEARKRADKQYYEAQVRLNTLQDYFKEKEVELQRKLGKEEMIRQDVSGKVQDVEEQYRLAKEQVELYQNQKDDLLKEMQESERSYRNQIAAIEKKAHESWMAARTSEREAQDSKREAATLRQKLLEAENTLAKEKSKYLVQSPPLIKPTPINGPPPFPPRFSPPLPPPGAPRHGPPFGRSPPQGHNGDFDGPPSPPPEMAFRGPPPPMGPPPLGPPPFRGPPDDFPDRDFDRRPGSERDFDHMPPSDRDFDRRPPSEPYSLPERDFGPDRDFAPGPYRGPPMDFPPPLRGGPPPMTPPSLRRGSAPLPPMPRGPPPPSGRISGPRELRGPPPPRRPDSRSTGPPSPPPMGIPRTSSPLDSPQHYMGPPPPGGPPPQHFSPHGPPPPRRSPNPPPMGRRPPPSDEDRRDRPPQQSSRLPT